MIERNEQTGELHPAAPMQRNLIARWILYINNELFWRPLTLREKLLILVAFLMFLRLLIPPIR